MQIIPAIDLRGGRCVRLRQGDYADETVFGDDAVAMAEHWITLGAQRLHLVDLDGARDGRPMNIDIVREVVRQRRVPYQFGGGVRSTEIAAELLDMGIDRVVVGTRAITDPEWFASLCEQFPRQICLGLDARSGMVTSDGWTQTSSIAATELAQRFDILPLAAIIYTDVSRDGMLSGVNLRAIAELVETVRTPVIASGGVASLGDLRELAHLPIEGCIVGRALYERAISLPDALRVVDKALRDQSEQ